MDIQSTNQCDDKDSPKSVEQNLMDTVGSFHRQKDTPEFAAASFTILSFISGVRTVAPPITYRILMQLQSYVMSNSHIIVRGRAAMVT